MSLLVTPEELARELPFTRKPLLIDTRPAENFCENHLPEAVHLDLFGISAVDTSPAPLNAFFWIIEHLLASRGVSTEVPVVVYDDTSGIRAARIFWFLEFFGHPDTRVLDGGYQAWIARGLPVTQKAVKPVPTDWRGGRHAKILADWMSVRDRLNAPGSVILDTRSDGEYCGATVRAARGGAIPGA
ncbi:MAG TPA: rhodanese-like domain-containing protein, partial [Vicinamibacterales bacterium]|nr:rhodanese-like domain-containing protein [Vicinamibacterales bacterium]